MFTVYHLTNDYLLQRAICWFSGLPVSNYFSGLTPEKLVRSPIFDIDIINKIASLKRKLMVRLQRWNFWKHEEKD